jgi:2-dehydro-3-deoxy-D-arabinonate dehydratase
MSLCRYSAADGLQWGWIREGKVFPLPEAAVLKTLTEPEADGLLALERAAGGTEAERALSALSAPVTEGMEVWAAGVTYESSKFARMAESESGGDFYAKVYVAERPELFFKATPRRVVGTGQPVRIRADATWNVPEPELAILVAATGQILGYTLGNDMSSRDIEGENPLYLPQAKVYRGACALGPVVTPAQALDPQNVGITLTITRGAETVFQQSTTTAKMRRTVHELADWLFRENSFPVGAYLMTGTGIIPPEEFTLHRGDTISIRGEGIGSLINPVAAE